MSTKISSFSERIVSLRQAQGMNQSDLARASGLKRATVSHLERGERNPSSETLAALSRALGATTDQLLGIDDSPKKTTPQKTYLDSLISKLKERDLQILIAVAEVLAGKK